MGVNRQRLTQMKKIAFTLFFLGCVASMQAQAKFEHAQTRIQEGMSEFFVRPMVAELQMINTECQEWTFNIFPGVSLSDISSPMLENAKANAAFKAAKLAGADIILGATFYVVNNEKAKGLDVTVRGYPAKYVKFHNYGEGQMGADDSKWIDPLQNGARIRSMSSDQKQNKAVGSETRTR